MQRDKSALKWRWKEGEKRKEVIKDGTAWQGDIVTRINKIKLQEKLSATREELKLLNGVKSVENVNEKRDIRNRVKREKDELQLKWQWKNKLEFIFSE